MARRKKYPKLRGRARELASKYIAEEFRTGKYKPSQAKAIGISRARAEVLGKKTVRGGERTVKRLKGIVRKLQTILSRY